MNFIKRLFNKNNSKSTTPYTYSKSYENWTMFSSSKKEIDEFLKTSGEITINQDNIQFENYIFEPSTVYTNNTIKAKEITDIAIKSGPISIRINDELIFVGYDQIEEIEKFIIDNEIKIVERNFLIEWILEPFLDTEYNEKRDIELNEIFSNYGLDTKFVNDLRSEVEIQMLKYNFDTMIWEWCSLGTKDVLRALRPKYSKKEFNEFYWKIMKIALLEKKEIN